MLGSMEGTTVGRQDKKGCSEIDGMTEGEIGTAVGFAVGERVGFTEGRRVGARVGFTEGVLEGV